MFGMGLTVRCTFNFGVYWKKKNFCTEKHTETSLKNRDMYQIVTVLYRYTPSVFKYGLRAYPEQLVWIIEGKGNERIAYERILWTKGKSLRPFDGESITFKNHLIQELNDSWMLNVLVLSTVVNFVEYFIALTHSVQWTGSAGKKFYVHSYNRGLSTVQFTAQFKIHPITLATHWNVAPHSECRISHRHYLCTAFLLHASLSVFVSMRNEA